MTETITPVILSGGAGTRLWPMSRGERPKQMLALTEDSTMLQVTARRTCGADYGAPIVVASAAHADMVEAQLAEAGCSPGSIILEPAARNTAPAIALAALAAGGGATPLLVMPSDHVIVDEAAFHKAIATALPLVRDGWLATFGITPTGPETGYGYIKAGSQVAPGVSRVERFVEKPPREKAEAMVRSGDHVWNGGIFLFRADRYLEELQRYAPDMLSAARSAMAAARRDGVRIMPDAAAFERSPSDSIDYAVMERAEQVAVVPVSMGWNDVGSWDALHAISECDTNANVCRGDVVALDTAGSLVHSDGPRIAVLGVTDLIVVASGNDILVLPRGRSQEVKRLIEAMKDK
ncbi:mannose-1-phosphate guanylyltransferase/mannose-6-phosphate isomerase [Stakelama sp. CBK3Z-3]|uniref:Mannose-1-phosphate guanylyltransferase/mannose-6-phosphate isomerase n=1 Tax=Stakelama flava TaxID=2860338 RepID=A0ABS6XIH8_9SPHN|nr:mannose-1-phosphate guanylyltransferase/mannose-6-phosphate isomerase [Stakelama flava]MBW4329996.1 mannose-1-phosphate guanylyltransferase/mannose-6-phosphate isomerase [Stakelama flava]